MPTLGATLGFALAALILIVIPGPSVLFTIGRAIALGRSYAVVSVAGNTFGAYIVLIAVAFGIGAVITASALAFTVIKLCGAAYLVYLGVQTIRHRKRVAAAVLTDDGPRQSRASVFRQAAIVGFTNPKTLAFFVAVMPQFVSKDAGHPWAQMLFFGAVFEVIAFVSDSAWGLAAGTARDWFARSPKRIENLSATGGVMMIVLGGVLASVRRA